MYRTIGRNGTIGLMVLVLLVLIGLAGCGEQSSDVPVRSLNEEDAAAARQVVEQFATGFINGDDLTSYGATEGIRAYLSRFNTDVRDKMIANLGAVQSYTIDKISMQRGGGHWVHATFTFANGHQEQFRFVVDQDGPKIYSFSSEYIEQLQQSEMRLVE